MSVSYLIITCNRREGLLSNLRSLFANDPAADVWIVDNASTDGTPEAVRQAFPQTRLLRLDRNLGMPARNVALRQMTSEFVAIIDDDSYPVGDAVARSVRYMQAHRDVAVVVGRAVLPDGRSEASAFPSILLGCASCVRLSAVREVGYFPDDFFRQAEEYDLSCRLWNAGHRVVRFEDVIYRHDKKPSASRASRDVTALDLKHNLIIAARYLPTPYYADYRADFIQRYTAIMRHAGHEADIATALDQADRYVEDSATLNRQSLSRLAFEAVFDHARQRDLVRRWTAEHQIERVAIADFSKNLFATYRACIDSGLEIASIVDGRETFTGLAYRGIAVQDASEIRGRDVDGIVVSNVNPGQIDAVAESVRKSFPLLPVLTLWRGRTLHAALSREVRSTRNVSSFQAA